MPLSELYRLAKRRVDSTQELEPTTDVFELVWQNGQITSTQGQSSRGKKDPTTSTNSQSLPSHCLPSQTPKPARAGKLGAAVEEIPMSVPSDEVGLSHDDEEDMIPWLSYQMDCPELLPELSGVTATPGEISNHFSSKTTNTSLGVINFSHFSRPAVKVKANARIGADLRLSERGSERPDKIGGAGEKNVAASSSVCSGNSVERASDAVKRKFRDAEDSECRSEEESFGGKKTGLPRASPGSKRSRATEVHNLSERRRRDRINEKMRALQELIPNCNKVDKASMLDEAIEYLKALQLQVQIMSMGSGLCMPQMMMPHMHMPHFPPMGMGMGIPNISGAAGFQGPYFPGPPMAGPGLQVFGLPSQGVSMPYLGPMMSGPFTKPNTAADNTETGQPTENKSSKNLTSGRCQATKERIERSASALNNAQLTDVNTGKVSASTNGNDAVPSRAANYDSHTSSCSRCE